MDDVLQGRTLSPPRKAFGRLLLCELRLAWRTPIGLGVGLGVPVLLVVIFGLIPKLTEPVPGLHGLSYFASTVPVLIGLSLMALGINALPRSLVTYRESGILRRFSTTPVPRTWVLAAQLLIHVGLGLIAFLLIVGVGMTFFHLQAPVDLASFILAGLVTMTAIFAIGLFIAAVASQVVATALGAVLFYLLLFFAGLWIPIGIMPSVLQTISVWTPLGASTAAIDVAIFGSSGSIHASPQYVLALVGYTVVFAILAVRFFRWE